MSTDPREIVLPAPRIVPIVRAPNTEVARSQRDLVRAEDSGAPPSSPLQDAAQVLLRFWKLIAACVAACVALALVALWFMSPVYEADALVQVDLSDKTYSTSLSDEMSGMKGQKTPVTAEIELLKSRLVLDPVIDQLRPDVVVEPRRLALIGAWASAHPWIGEPLRAAYFGVGGYGWGGEKLEFERLDLPPTLIGVPLELRVSRADPMQFTLSDGIRDLATGKVGEPVEAAVDGELLKLQVRTLLGAPGVVFNVMRSSRAEAMSALVKGYRASEQGRDSGLIKVSFRGEDPELVTRVVTLTIREYQGQDVRWRTAKAGRTLAFLDSQLPALKAKVEAAEAALTRHKLNKKAPDLPAETTLLLQQSVAAEQNLQVLRQQREDLQQRFTANHPSMQTIEAQIAQASSKRAEIESRIQTLPGSQRDLAGLTRDLEVNMRLYVAMLDEVQQLEVAKSGTIGMVRIVDEALVPTAPVFPRPPIIVAAAIIAGLIGGSFLATMLGAMRNRIDSADQLEQLLGRRCMATVRLSPLALRDAKIRRGVAGDPLPLLTRTDPSDPAAEDIRRLRSAVLTDAATGDGGVLLVAGVEPGVGRSFVVANLGVALVAASQRTVIVDLDIEGRSLERYFRCEPSGVLDWLARRAHTVDAVVTVGAEGFPDVVPAGDARLAGASALPPQRLRSLMSELRRRYDYVLVNVPALSTFTDGLVVASTVDAVVLVARQSQRSRPVMEAAQRLTRAGANVAGVVLNRVRSTDRLGHIGEVARS